jgi:signal transduction histidine kinase
MMQRWWFWSTATALAIIGIVAFALLWPLPDVGFTPDLATGEVVYVQPDSPAAQADVRPSDVVMMIYGYPWTALNDRLLVVPIPWRRGTPTPLVVLRDGATIDLTIRTDAPDPVLQAEKAIRALIAFTCWMTGVLLGASPRARDPALRRTAWFWVLLGGTLGLYPLASIVSYPFTIAVLWMQCTVLAPLAVAVHFWYPSRPIPSLLQQRTQWWLIGVMMLFQIGALGLTSTASTTVERYIRWHSIAPVMFLMSFGLSTIVLWRAYRRTPIAHVRRQISLIATACAVTGCGWVILLLGDIALPRWSAQLPPGRFVALAALIPLAYLVGGVSADLMRLDQIARRVLVHLLAGVSVFSLIVGVVQVQLVIGTPTLVIVLGLALYPPFLRLSGRIVFGRDRDAIVYEPLQHAIADLGTTLDTDRLAQRIAQGIRQTFHQPPLTLYLQRDTESERLERVIQMGMDTPLHVALPDSFWAQETALLPASTIQQHAQETAHDPELSALIFHPEVAVWGIIRRPNGPLLGVMLIGPRGDIDPYQQRDFAQLQHLLTAAALALTNSASYTEQVENQRIIRQLYQRMQHTQERTAAQIAREIHDEVINITLFLNKNALARLIAQTTEPALRRELQTILDGEQEVSDVLRVICEDLQPGSIEDTWNVAGSLRGLERTIHALWDGEIETRIVGEPLPVSERVHREVVRIAREALLNAAKHANAGQLTVELVFPATTDGYLTLRVSDDGANSAPVVPRKGHLGLRFMHESADAIGGKIAWVQPATGGTTVLLYAPLDEQCSLPLPDPAQGHMP